MSFASAKPPALLPTTLDSMAAILRRHPRPAPAARIAGEAEVQAFAFAVPPHAAPAQVHERRVYEVRTAAGIEGQLVLIGGRLSPEQAIELRRAVAQAVADGRKLKLRVDRGENRGGGSDASVFDINIQTIVRGE
jgi:hypothetical protein